MQATGTRAILAEALLGRYLREIIGMKCPYCEADISETARKCRYCGEWVKSKDAPAIAAGAAIPAPAASRPPAPQQTVTVNVPKEESVAFAVVTLLLYIFVYPLGLLLNLVGLLTGPRRGCFLTMILLFVVLPAIIIFGVLGLTVDGLIESIEDFTR